MIAGCYDLRLECDGAGCRAGGYGRKAVGNWNLEMGSACRSAARRAGWRMSPRTGRCLCPSCVKRGAKVTS